ncbi:hypothetical protein B0J18DRAFT_107041 [Chaetomium sp. MPI-SDFR-AT-0129]|nr:hypothetical protein B0J18DRAFT_107041 [Chaetomium sp. MPI-SDFR-AT-0129]
MVLRSTAASRCRMMLSAILPCLPIARGNPAHTARTRADRNRYTIGSCQEFLVMDFVMPVAGVRETWSARRRPAGRRGERDGKLVQDNAIQSLLIVSYDNNVKLILINRTRPRQG